MSLNVENTHTSFAGIGPNSQTKLQIQVISQFLSRGEKAANCLYHSFGFQNVCSGGKREKPSPLAEYLGKPFKGRCILSKD